LHSLIRLQHVSKLVIKCIQCLQQRGPPVCGNRVQKQIAIRIAMNLDPLGIKPELTRNAHGLAVAVDKNPADACLHGKLLVHT